MILVDTSVWVDHLRANDETLVNLLKNDQVSIHPFVVGELACGNLRNRAEILKLLQDLPQATVASDKEVPDRASRPDGPGHRLCRRSPAVSRDLERHDEAVDTRQAPARGG